MRSFDVGTCSSSLVNDTVSFAAETFLLNSVTINLVDGILVSVGLTGTDESILLNLGRVSRAFWTLPKAVLIVSESRIAASAIAFEYPVRRISAPSRITSLDNLLLLTDIVLSTLLRNAKNTASTVVSLLTSSGSGTLYGIACATPLNAAEFKPFGFAYVTTSDTTPCCETVLLIILT